jgi:hypothetical protein
MKKYKFLINEDVKEFTCPKNMEIRLLLLAKMTVQSRFTMDDLKMFVESKWFLNKDISKEHDYSKIIGRIKFVFIKEKTNELWSIIEVKKNSEISKKHYLCQLNKTNII